VVLVVDLVVMGDGGGVGLGVDVDVKVEKKWRQPDNSGKGRAANLINQST
jgi:hypothetical protein